jgi:hypothetical protein
MVKMKKKAYKKACRDLRQQISVLNHLNLRPCVSIFAVSPVSNMLIARLHARLVAQTVSPQSYY